ncbi:MAG: dihydroorotate dehydrogenase electron transfer subunit [Candidatus Bilamarchaeaceae archaeon]
MRRSTATIAKIIRENGRTTTIVLDAEMDDAEPGQFAMLWIPGKNEKPFSFKSKAPVAFTIVGVGEFSEELCRLKEGEQLTFNGPLGKGFGLGKNKKILLVGGGCGVVPLLFMAQEAKKKKIHAEIVIGARSKDGILLKKEFEKLGCTAHISTDDGSEGFKGNAVQLSEKMLADGKFDEVYSCGPEIMMFHLAKLCKKLGVPGQFSLERKMKCGMGLCGSCAINGRMVCSDGPVFDRDFVVEAIEKGGPGRGSCSK